MFLSWLKGRGKSVGAGAACVDDLGKTLRGMSVFKDLSDDTITELCTQMESMAVKKGTVVIRQGDEGDYFYAIVHGKAEVTRREGGGQASSGGGVRVAVLTAGMGFGDEALVSCANRNATVTMVEDGVLLRLSRVHFDDLLKAPRLRWLSGVEGRSEVARGAQWLDVRAEDEHLWRSLQGSPCIPLENIRAGAASLDKAKLYVCYCETGRQSATAAFLLTQMGYRAAVLRGGLRQY